MVRLLDGSLAEVRRDGHDRHRIDHLARADQRDADAALGRLGVAA